MWRRKKRIVENDLSLLYEQMAAMLAAGMGIAEVIKILAEDGDSSPLDKLLKNMNSEIRGGKPAGEVLRNNLDPLASVPFEVGGCKSEDVSKLFEGMSDHCEKKDVLKSYVKEAMTYPAIIMIIVSVLAMGLMIFVIPILQEMFADMGRMLPPATRIMIDLSLIFRRTWPIILLAVNIPFFIHRHRKVLFYNIVDKLPFIGKLNRKVAAAEFIRNLCLLFPFNIGKKIVCTAAARSVSNPYLSKNLVLHVEKAGDGVGVSDLIRDSRIVPFPLVQTIAIGDRSGKLQHALSRVASYCERDVEKSFYKYMSILPPLFIIAVGTIVGWIVIAMYLPIFAIGGAFAS